jgi:hypothetical protein
MPKTPDEISPEAGAVITVTQQQLRWVASFWAVLSFELADWCACGQGTKCVRIFILGVCCVLCAEVKLCAECVAL